MVGAEGTPDVHPRVHSLLASLSGLDVLKIFIDLALIQLTLRPDLIVQPGVHARSLLRAWLSERLHRPWNHLVAVYGLIPRLIQ